MLIIYLLFFVVEIIAKDLHRVQKKVVYFDFERNFTTTGSIFLQLSMTITKFIVYKYVILSKIYLA